MPLKLNLTVPNKAVHAFIGIVVILVLAASTYAWVVADLPLPVPPVGQVVGHSLDAIQGYFVGDISLRDTLAKLQQRPVAGMSCAPGSSIRLIDVEGNVDCELDNGGGGSATCRWLDCGGQGWSGNCLCDPDEYVLGLQKTAGGFFGPWIKYLRCCEFQ